MRFIIAISGQGRTDQSSGRNSSTSPDTTNVQLLLRCCYYSRVRRCTAIKNSPGTLRLVEQRCFFIYALSLTFVSRISYQLLSYLRFPQIFISVITFHLYSVDLKFLYPLSGKKPVHLCSARYGIVFYTL